MIQLAVNDVFDGILAGVARTEGQYSACAIAQHLEMLSTVFADEALRLRPMRVAVDCGNGSCAVLVPRWLAALGCEVLPINDDPSLPFPRLPEPTVATASQARALVRAGNADLGLVLDADGERLSLVDETGQPLSEELTLPLAVEAAKAAIDGGLSVGIQEGLVLEARSYEVTLFTEDRIEALAAFKEKRPPKFQGK